MNNIIFDIDNIAKIATDLKFTLLSKTEKLIKVKLIENWILVFENIENKDTLIYFDQNHGWHTHGDIYVETNNISINDVPLLILMELQEGKLLLVEQTLIRENKEVKDKYFEDTERLNHDYFKYIEPGECIKIVRINLTNV
jgi:hypothetical protein